MAFANTDFRKAASTAQMPSLSSHRRHGGLANNGWSFGSAARRLPIWLTEGHLAQQPHWTSRLAAAPAVGVRVCTAASRAQCSPETQVGGQLPRSTSLSHQVSGSSAPVVVAPASELQRSLRLWLARSAALAGRQRLLPNPSLVGTATGKALGPQAGVGSSSVPRASAFPASAPQLKRLGGTRHLTAMSAISRVRGSRVLCASWLERLPFGHVGAGNHAVRHQRRSPAIQQPLVRELPNECRKVPATSSLAVPYQPPCRQRRVRGHSGQPHRRPQSAEPVSFFTVSVRQEWLVRQLAMRPFAAAENGSQFKHQWPS